MLNAERAVQGDRNAVNRAINNLNLWEIPQDEIDALQAEAEKICSDKNAWFKTPEGRWVMREKQAHGGKVDPHKEAENPWGRVTLRAPFDGVVVERNLHVDEMVVDNTVNLFQIADVSRLLVLANCPEDALPTLEALSQNERKWTVQTVGGNFGRGTFGNDRRNRLRDRPQSAHGDHQGLCRQSRDGISGRANTSPPRCNPAAGRRGRDSRRCAGGRRQAELGVRAARPGQAAVHDAARPRDASVRPTVFVRARRSPRKSN